MERENHYSTYSQAFKGQAKRQSRKLNRSDFLSHPYESNLDNAKGGQFTRTSAAPFLALADTQQGQILYWQPQRPLAKGCVAHLCKSPHSQRHCLALQGVQNSFNLGRGLLLKGIWEFNLFIFRNYTHTFLHQLPCSLESSWNTKLFIFSIKELFSYLVTNKNKIKTPSFAPLGFIKEWVNKKNKNFNIDPEKARSACNIFSPSSSFYHFNCP